MIAGLMAGLAVVLGSIPSGLVVVRLRTGHDIRRHGSGNIGASNVHSLAGKWSGIMVGTLDIAKGVLPVLIGRWYGLNSWMLALVALAAVLGHDFSLFLRFHGGKGVATSFGVAVVLAPLPTLGAIVLWVVVLYGSRYASVASLAALAALPLLFCFARAPTPYVVLGLALFALTVAKHRDNLMRLTQGIEASIDGGPGKL